MRHKSIHEYLKLSATTGKMIKKSDSIKGHRLWPQSLSETAIGCHPQVDNVKNPVALFNYLESISSLPRKKIKLSMLDHY